VFAAALLMAAAATAPASVRLDHIDMGVAAAMRDTGARGLAVAVIERGRPVFARTYGDRNAKSEPLTTNTVMYGASLTKAAFAHYVLQLAHEGRIDLDRSIAEYLPRPLPSYGNLDAYGAWGDLAGDERWREVTPRILLTHSAGFANFHWDEPDRKLRIRFDPGTRYSYSGEGIILLQFVLERGLGLDVGAEMQRRIFSPAGMVRTSLKWRPDFATDLADGWRADGTVEPHDERSRVRAAGSMDTTIADMAKLASFVVRGEGLSGRGRAALFQPHLPITTRSQFPALQPELPKAERWPGLAAGLGVVTFTGPQGRGFFKGGHNDSTGNMWVCLERRQRCVVLLANDVRAELAFPDLVDSILGPTGLPWGWEFSWLPAPGGK
jgi:CubicO group peptidase (beta-lactamase class C family)